MNFPMFVSTMVAVAGMVVWGAVCCVQALVRRVRAGLARRRAAADASLRFGQYAAARDHGVEASG